MADPVHNAMIPKSIRRRPDARALRVLSLPGKSHPNRYFALYLEGVERAGVEVVDKRSSGALVGAYDVLHVHFPAHLILAAPSQFEATLWAVTIAALFVCAKLSGKRIVYTVHNVEPFITRRSRISAPFMRFFYHLCDGYVFLNESSRAAFFAKFARERLKPWCKVSIGPYPTGEASEGRRRVLRAGLDPSGAAFLVGFLGSIKAYKGVEALIHLPERLSDGRLIRVVVAGRVESAYAVAANDVFARMPDDQLVRLDRSPNDDELDALIQAMDVVLLPYTAGSNSSAAVLVLSNRRQVIASDLSMFRDLEELVGEPWIRILQSDSSSGAGNYLELLDGAAAPLPAEAESKLDLFLEETSFERGGLILKSFYRSISKPAGRASTRERS